MSSLRISVLAVSLFLILIPAHAAEKKSAMIECTPTDEKLVFDCMVMLTGKKSGEVIADAEFTVAADMPSMPMAHNVEPVSAHSVGNGMYHARITLEMHGEWVLKLEFTKPERDLVVSKLVFSKASVSPSDGHDHKHEHKKNKD